MPLVKRFGERLAWSNIHFKGYFRTEMALIAKIHSSSLEHMLGGGGGGGRGGYSIHLNPSYKIRGIIVTLEDFRGFF